MNWKAISTAAVLAAGGTAAGAAPVFYATGFNDVVVGTDQQTANGRANASNILGAPDSPTPCPSPSSANCGFYDLGIGGSIDLTFGLPTGQPFRGGASLVEITFNARGAAREALKVFGVDGAGVATLLQSFTNDGPTGPLTVSFNFSGIYEELRLVDDSLFGDPGSGEQAVGGIDIDSVSVAAIPVPAAGLLLLSALGGLAAWRRRAA